MQSYPHQTTYRNHESHYVATALIKVLYKHPTKSMIPETKDRLLHILTYGLLSFANGKDYQNHGSPLPSSMHSCPFLVTDQQPDKDQPENTFIRSHEHQPIQTATNQQNKKADEFLVEAYFV